MSHYTLRLTAGYRNVIYIYSNISVDLRQNEIGRLQDVLDGETLAGNGSIF